MGAYDALWDEITAGDHTTGTAGPGHRSRPLTRTPAREKSQGRGPTFQPGRGLSMYPVPPEWRLT